MFLNDVNVLVYAFREEFPGHRPCRDWLFRLLNGEGSFGVSDLVLSSFLRIATHPGILDPPAAFEAALKFAETLRNAPNAVPVVPRGRHFEIFVRLCRETKAKGNLVPDAYLAAMAIESGCVLVTTDRDFERFSGLRHRHPFAE